MTEEEKDLLARIIETQNVNPKKGSKKFQIMSHIDEIIHANKAGVQLKIIWNQLFKEQKIDCQYDYFVKVYTEFTTGKKRGRRAPDTSRNQENESIKNVDMPVTGEGTSQEKADIVKIQPIKEGTQKVKKDDPDSEKTIRLGKEKPNKIFKRQTNPSESKKKFI